MSVLLVVNSEDELDNLCLGSCFAKAQSQPEDSNC